MHTKSNMKILGIIALVVILLPFIIKSPYYIQILINIASLTIVSTGLSLLLGFAGQISFAQAAFFGIGAYTSAITTVTLGWPPILALIVSVVITGILAFLIGLPVLRFKEHFLALVTIGFGIMVFVLMMQLSNITGGPGGFSGIPPFSIAGLKFNSDMANYYLIWFITLTAILLFINLLSSRIGRALETLRSSEVAAKSMGINAFALKMKAFIFAAVLAGLGGSLYAFQTSFIAPNTFEVLQSITYLTVVVVGGLRSVWGSLIGAIVVTIMGEGLTNLLPLILPNAGGELQVIAYGLLLVLVMLFIPNGIGPSLHQWIKKSLFSKKSTLPKIEQKEDYDLVDQSN
jgi:branched-chain amino acid transport system permease protein